MISLQFTSASPLKKHAAIPKRTRRRREGSLRAKADATNWSAVSHKRDGRMTTVEHETSDVFL